MSLQDILHEAQVLSPEERRELIKMLADTLAPEGTSPQKHSLRELRGLGKEIWVGVDPQEYVNQQRDEWDQKR